MTRQCGDCALCCYMLHIIPETKWMFEAAPNKFPFEKAANEWCKHCTGHSCRIYDNRFSTCRSFRCGWLNGLLPDYWYPKKSKIIITASPERKVLDFNVHHRHPNRWKEQPYYSDIKKMAASKKGWHTYVSCQTKSWLITPDQDIPFMG